MPVGALMLVGCSRCQLEQPLPLLRECAVYGFRSPGWIIEPNRNGVWGSWEIGMKESNPVRFTTTLSAGETLEMETDVPTSSRRSNGTISMIERVAGSEVLLGPGGVSLGCKTEPGPPLEAASVKQGSVTAAWRVRVLAPDGGVLLERPAAR